MPLGMADIALHYVRKIFIVSSSIQEVKTLNLSVYIASFLFFSFFFFFSFRDRVSLCSPGYPGTRSVDQAGSASPMGTQEAGSQQHGSLNYTSSKFHTSKRAC